MAVENQKNKRVLEIVTYVAFAIAIGLFAEGFLEIFNVRIPGIVIPAFAVAGLVAAYFRAGNSPTQ